jgi:N-acetyl-anhydromuramoyl-L-alanine amidase
MHIDTRTGLVAPARQLPSPNCDERPPGAVPELIVLHGISLPPGQFGGDAIDRLFTNTLAPTAHPYFREIAALRVSAHLLIRRDGELVQYVALHRRAWHAGESCYRGRPACNDYSIGIELEGSDDTPYGDAQYARLAELVRALLAHYPTLDLRRVVGHCDVAPGRKSDPGPAFDWPRLYRSVSDAAPAHDPVL